MLGMSTHSKVSLARLVACGRFLVLLLVVAMVVTVLEWGVARGE